MRVSSLSCRGSKWILTPIWSRIVSPIWTWIVSPIWTRAYGFVTPRVRCLLEWIREWIWPPGSPPDRDELPSPQPEPCPSDEPPSLPNIGSTCFFNSTLQVILLIKDMLLKTFEKARTGVTHTFHCNEYNEDIVVEITFADKPMTSAFIKFLNAVKDKGHILTALWNLHSRIAERYQRFSSFDQQDSEEVLRCLLDGIRTEEINATRDGIEVVVSEMERSSDEKKNLIRGAQRKAFRISTLVDTVFGGKCINTVICRECLKPLQLEEPFLDLSVPLPDNSTHTSYEISSDEATGSCETEDREEAKNPISVQKLLRDHEPITKLISPTTESPEHFSNDLKHCLTLYTTLDVLDEDNKFICDPCTDRLKKEWRDKKQAAKKNKPPPSSIAVPDNNEPEYAECLVSKQLLIHELPPALILHMKRFLLGIPVRKNNLHIDFPGDLDMAPYCTINCEVDPGKDQQIMYDLLGVVQHSGSLHGGHYTAYVKYKCCSNEHFMELPGDLESGKILPASGHHWFYTSDSWKELVRRDDVNGSQAYLLLYVKRYQKNLLGI